MRISTKPRFRREAKKLPDSIKEILGERILIFQENAHDNRLHAHKLKGSLVKFWAFSLNAKFRLMFEFVSDNEVILRSVGDHSIYD